MLFLESAVLLTRVFSGFVGRFIDLGSNSNSNIGRVLFLWVTICGNPPLPHLTLAPRTSARRRSISPRTPTARPPPVSPPARPSPNTLHHHNVYAAGQDPLGCAPLPPPPIPSALTNPAPAPAGAARLRPTTALLHRHLTPTLTAARFQSTSTTPATTPDPKTKAQSLLDSLPGNSLVSKTAILSSAAGLSIWAISSELYVVNEETIVAFSLLTVFVAIAKYGGPLYKEWADTHVARIRDVLNSARDDHTQAVKDRIENVSQMGTVVEVTRDLFAVSKVCVFFFFYPTDAIYCWKRDLILFFFSFFIGNCPARSTGVPARAADQIRSRGKVGPRLVGPLRSPGEATTAARARRVLDCEGQEGAGEPQDPFPDSAAERGGC